MGDIGPQNTGHMHFYTDRSNFYFGTEIQVDGGSVRSHNEDLNLNRAGSGSARIRITSGRTYSDQAFTSTTDVRAPIFYDSNDPNYYVDPNSTSRMYYIRSTGNIEIQNGSPTLYLRDTNHRSAMVHVNSNIFYVLRGSGNNSTSWSQTNGRWPLEINLNNNDAYFGADVTAHNYMYAQRFYDRNNLLTI
jgi:hypothetical protein